MEARTTPQCPRCGALLAVVSADQPAECSGCGLLLPPELVAELGYLDRLQDWVGQRRSWVAAMADYLAASPEQSPAAALGAAATTAAAPGIATTPLPQQPRTGTAQGCLLTAGAFALVAAGITFVAVAWGTLSDVGRFSALLIAGLLALLIAWWSAPRIKATASTLAIAGSLLVVVDVVFLMANTEPDRAVPVAVLAAGIGVAGVAYARRIKSRLPGAAAAVAISSAVLAVLAIAALPLLGEWDGDWAPGWAAAVFVLSGLAILAWGAVDDTVAWSWPATVWLVIAAGPAADQASRLVADSAGGLPDWLLPLATVLLVAAALLLLDRITGARWPALLAGSVALHGVVALALVATLGVPAQRPWTALVLLVWAGSWIGLIAHAHAHHRRIADVLSVLTPWVAAVATAISVAALLAYAPGLREYDDFQGTDAVRDAYPWLRGALLGLVTTALAAVAARLLRDRPVPEWTQRFVIPVWPVVVLVPWIGMAAADSDRGAVYATGSWNADLPAAATAVAAALLVTGSGVLLLSARVREPWPLWLGAATAVGGVLAAVAAWDTSAWSTPELLGLALAAPLAAAGAVHAWIARPRTLPTLIIVAPGLVALLAPSTLSVLSDTTDRWFSSLFLGEQPVSTAALVRGLSLAVVAAALAVVGARQRWAGVFWPGLVCLVLVVGAQLVDLADRIPPWLVLTGVGVLLVGAGARWEVVRAQGRRGRAWAGHLR